jgi:hypothetical protein
VHAEENCEQFNTLFYIFPPNHRWIVWNWHTLVWYCSLFILYYHLLGALNITVVLTALDDNKDVYYITLRTEAVSFSETLVTVYQTTWCNIPEDSHLHMLMSYKNYDCYTTVIFMYIKPFCSVVSILVSFQFVPNYTQFTTLCLSSDISWFNWLTGFRCCYGHAITQVVSCPLHSRGPGSHPGQSMWDFWWVKCYWNRFFSEFFAFPLSISFHHSSPFSYMIWGMNNRPVGRSSERQSHPINMNNNNKWCYTHCMEIMQALQNVLQVVSVWFQTQRISVLTQVIQDIIPFKSPCKFSF